MFCDEVKHILLAKAEHQFTDCDAEHITVTLINSDGPFFPFDSDDVGRSMDSSFGRNTEAQLIRLIDDKNCSNESVRISRRCEVFPKVQHSDTIVYSSRCLFSLWGLVFNTKHSQVGDKKLEKLVLLKAIFQPR